MAKMVFRPILLDNITPLVPLHPQLNPHCQVLITILYPISTLVKSPQLSLWITERASISINTRPKRLTSIVTNFASKFAIRSVLCFADIFGLSATGTQKPALAPLEKNLLKFFHNYIIIFLPKWSLKIKNSPFKTQNIFKCWMKSAIGGGGKSE